VRTGITARLLAPPAADPDAALAAGLLHNIGLMLMSVTAPNVFRQLLEAANAGARLAPYEHELLGVTHAELGALVTERWSYPPLLVAAIREHDFTDPESALARTVRLADLVTRRSGCGVEAPESLHGELISSSPAAFEDGVDALVASSTVSSRDLAACLLEAA
jgi:HD-like signal output (HDOD) protein